MLTLIKIHPGKVFFFLLFFYAYGFLYALFFGYLCGTVIDRLIALYRKRKLENLLFLALGKLARADGQIREEEIDRANLVFNQLGVTGTRREQAQNHFRLGSQPDFDLDVEIRSFVRRGAPLTQRGALLEMLIIFSIDDAGGQMSLGSDYYPVLEHIAVLLEIPQQMFQSMLAILTAQASFHHSGGAADPFGGSYGGHGHQGHSPHYAPSDMLATAYQALGASSSDSDAEIKKKYRRLVNKFHPDKMAGTGVGTDAAIELAKEKTQQIQSAYEQIKRARGMK